MIKKYLPLFATLFLTMPLITKAEKKYNINNDTIKVSSSSYPFLRFIGEVQNANILCEDYKIVRTSTTITVRPKVSKPAPTCMLIVSEGTQSSPRQHTFIITYAKEVPANQLLHDYSSKALIEKRIAYLENPGAGGGDASEAAPEEQPKEKKGFLNLGKKKAKMPEIPKAEAPKAEVPKAEAPKAKAPKNVAKKEAAQPEKEAEETANTQSQAEEPVAKTKPQTVQSSGGTDEENDEIRNIPIDKIEERVKLKINSFYDACGLLCAKTDIEESIKYGMKLFNNDESVLVETTNGKTNAKSRKNIRPYLNHLSQLKYSKVEMNTSEIRFVSDFHMGPDKKWHASAVIIQDFNGYKDNELVYKDKTNKTIDIIVNVFDVVKDGKVIKKFDIFLGNISVTNIP